MIGIIKFNTLKPCHEGVFVRNILHELLRLVFDLINSSELNQVRRE